MTQLGFPSEASASGPDVAWPRLPEWARLLLLVGALACATVGYRAHFTDLPWWRWVLALLAGWTLFTLGLRRQRPPAEGALRRWTRRAFGALAVCATAVAIHLFPQLGREVATGIAIGVALAAFMVARWVPFAPEDVRALIGEPTPAETQHPPFTLTRWITVGLSLTAAVAAAVVNPEHHLAAFLLWLASLCLFAAAMWQRRAPAGDEPAQRWVSQGGPQLSWRTEAVALLLVLILAGVLRVVLLPDVPAVIDPDEGRQGRYAERIWQNGFPDAFDLGWNVFPHLSYMFEYTWVQLLGTSNPHLRLAAATAGVLSLVPAFFWVRRWWGNVIALLAVLLLAVNWEHVTWSRLALNNIQQVLVASLMLASFARLLRTRQWIDWVWFGFATGLAFHTYHAAKLFPALIAVVGLLFMLGIRGFARRYVAGALVGALAFLLCFGPLGVTIYQKWDAFYGGTSNRSDLAHLTDAYHRQDVHQVRSYIDSHVLGCLYSFISTPSPEAATFDAFAAVPFLLGVGWMLWNWRDPRHLVLLVWTAGILGIGGMITDYPPWKARLLGYLPAVFVIAAVVVGRIRETLFRWFPVRADLITVPLLLVWLGGTFYRNWDTEFFYWPSRQRGVDLMREICRVVDNTPTPATFYMARGGETVDLKVSLNDCMIAADPERVLVNLPDDPAIVPIRPDNHGTAVLLVTSYQQELVPLIRHYYPEARYAVVNDPHYGQPVLHVFTISVAEIERTRGLRLTYQTPRRTWSLDAASAKFVPPQTGEFPASAKWRGLIWLPAPGPYAFRMRGGTLRLDEKPVANDNTRLLPAGWHPIEVGATFNEPGGQITLEWKPPGAASWTAIPRESLHPHPLGHGLLGRYFAAAIATSSPDAIAAPPDYTRIDGALSFDYVPQQDDVPPAPFAARPSTMEWIGTVEVPEGDPPTLRLDTTTPAQVFINGVLVLSSPGTRDGQPVDAELPSLKGRVSILVRTVRAADDEWRFWKLRLLWREPGSGWTAFATYRPPESPG